MTFADIVEAELKSDDSLPAYFKERMVAKAAELEVISLSSKDLAAKQEERGVIDGQTIDGSQGAG